MQRQTEPIMSPSHTNMTHPSPSPIHMIHSSWADLYDACLTSFEHRFTVLEKDQADQFS